MWDMETICETQKNRKEMEVERDPDDHDLLPSIELIRDNALVGLMMMPIGSSWEEREKALDAIVRAVVGFSATEIVMVQDAVTCPIAINPVTGQKWERGELVKEKDKPWVCEGLVITHATDDGTLEGDFFYYEVKDGELRWLDYDNVVEEIDAVLDEMGYDADRRNLIDELIHPELEEGREFREELRDRVKMEGMSFEGAYIDAVREGFGKRSEFDVMEKLRHMVGAPEEHGLTEEQARAHADCATVKVIMQAYGFPFMLGAPEEGTERADVIRNSFSEGGYGMEEISHAPEA